MSFRRFRISRLGIAALLAAWACLVLTGCSAILPASEGPWTTSSEATVEFPLATGADATWGMDLPPNGSAADIELLSIEPAHVSGLEVLGVSISPVGPEGSIANALDYPPPGASPGPVDGVIVAPSGEGSTGQQVLIGVRRTDGDTAGIDGLRVRYRIDSTTYENTWPWMLRLRTPGS